MTVMSAEAPNFKSQITNKYELSEIRMNETSLEFDYSLLGFVCDLVLGHWSFGLQRWLGPR
jgi:hypothetical protein